MVEAPLVTNSTAPAVHSLRVFVDHAVVEAQLDGSTAIMEGFFPLSPKDAVVVRVYAGVDAAINISSVEVWGAWDPRGCNCCSPGCELTSIRYVCIMMYVCMYV